MPLTALTWKQLPTQTGVYNSPPLALNAIYTAFTSATYADGSARTPGSGVAWTATRYQAGGTTTEAVYFAPVGSTLNSYSVIAGAALAQASAAYAALSGAAANVLYVGTGKNVTGGSPYAANWYANAGSPFTSGQFTGYMRTGITNSTLVASTSIRCYESQDAVMIISEYNGTVAWSAVMGAFVDPNSASSACAESDGKLYGAAVGPSHSTTPTTAVGYLVGFFTASNGPFSNDRFLNAYPALIQSGSIWSAQNYLFLPGSATIFRAQIAQCIYDISAAWRTRSNLFVRFPIMLGANSGSTTTRPATAFVGRLREIVNIGAGATNGQKITDGGVDVGYIVTYSASATTNPTVMLLA